FPDKFPCRQVWIPACAGMTKFQSYGVIGKTENQSRRIYPKQPDFKKTKFPAGMTDFRFLLWFLFSRE
ncbi:hypothetical protein ACDU97_001333, partial [Neisseria gonorrhoeae]